MLKILVVDDEETIRTYIARVLVTRGLMVQTASSAEEALQACADRAFDAVLSDIIMPGGMGGLELADLVVKKWPSTRIILMTGYASPNCRTAYPVLYKPFTPSILAEHIVRLCGRVGEPTPSL